MSIVDCGGNRQHYVNQQKFLIKKEWIRKKQLGITKCFRFQSFYIVLSPGLYDYLSILNILY